MVDAGLVTEVPMTGAVAAVSCGLFEGEVVLDLDYAEDSNAEADANFVLTDDGLIIEVQGTAEARPFTPEQFLAMMELARQGVVVLAAQQRKALGLE
jgi:ribonuclease PH